MPTTATILLRVSLPFALGYFLSYLYRAVNAVIAPELVADLGLDPAALGLLTSTYFLTFALAQLPLGLLLDRYGPRWVETVLLLFAAGGALLFARATSLEGLVLGRALIGFGVSACLMAAFKAFVMWYPVHRLPLVNGLQMAAGGLGALTATTPVRTALTYTDWRGVFLLLAVLTAVVAIVLFRVVPERVTEGAGESLAGQLRGIREVFSSPVFWRIAPWAVASQTAFLSIQGLWSGPWLRDVGGFDSTGVARMLLIIAAAMVAGFLLLGFIAERFARSGIRPALVAGCGMSLFMLAQLVIVLGGGPWPILVWILFGFFGTTSILPYAILSQSFPTHLAGRVNTGHNLLVFLAAFAAQWGIGAIIGLWPHLADGRFATAGYQTAFGLILLLQIVASAWYGLAGWRRED
jgi:MFS family permease